MAQSAEDLMHVPPPAAGLPHTGTLAIHRRTFTRADFQNFAALSGDHNPLHADDSYASAAGYGAVVVPLHLSAAPLSALVGMALPGRRALYMGHSLAALRPVLFDRPITYSARVAAASEAAGALDLRVLAIQDGEVAFDARVQVRCRDEPAAAIDPQRWPAKPWPLVDPPVTPTVVVTGASGVIAGTTALRLAERGHSLLLQTRAPGPGLATLVDRAHRLGVGVTVVEADIGTPAGLDAFVDALSRLDGPPRLFHCAAAPLEAAFAHQVAVSFPPLQAAWDRLRTQALVHQDGRFLFLGSSAQIEHPAGMEAYTAAKQAASGLLDGIGRRYGDFGVVAGTLAPGRVDTAYSRLLPPGPTPPLQPEEVARVAADWISAALPPTPGLQVLYPGGGPQPVAPSSARAAPSEGGTDRGLPDKRQAPVPASPGLSPIAQAIAEHLGLPSGSDHTRAALGVTAGWDSFRQIQLVLAMEEQFGVRLSSADVESAKTLTGLAQAIQRAMAGRP
ncbi:MAG: SDR family NAD(P)-dependent oxidoreductase [Rhodospirillaceae bacterium]|nr:SDR family NAD(P)-dependent oxidoreductase [Rhodospirillaceae bacterium]